jgi:hypothetical protein
MLQGAAYLVKAFIDGGMPQNKKYTLVPQGAT